MILLVNVLKEELDTEVCPYSWYTMWLIITSIMKYVKLLIHSDTSMAEPLKSVNGWVISSNILQDMWFLIHDGIKNQPC